VRKGKQASLGIISAAYLRDYKILILFSNDRMKIIDFGPAIQKYAKGDFKIYANKAQFKKFKVENNNIAWGENWDLIFPVDDVFAAQF
jgi:hypothetical protein